MTLSAVQEGKGNESPRLPFFAGLLLRGAGSVISPAGRHARLVVLVYHRVLPERDPLMPETVDAATFEWQTRVLAHHFKVLPLGKALELWRHGALPARAVSITFDDGYADNATVALPILQRWRLPATFFIATDYLDGGRMWNDSIIEAVRRAPPGELDLESFGMGLHMLESWWSRRHTVDLLLSKLKYLSLQERDVAVTRLCEIIGASLPENLMMSSRQLLELRDARMDIGAHTLQHPILARLDDEQSWREINGARIALRERLDMPVNLFAYPNGRPGQDYERRHVEMVRRAGFSAAVSTAWGVVCAGADIYQLPRAGSWDPSPLRFGMRLLSTCMASPAQIV